VRNPNAHLDFAKLNRADIRAMDARIVRELFLGHAGLAPPFPNFNSE
jgi:hypothetical protein